MTEVEQIVAWLRELERDEFRPLGLSWGDHPCAAFASVADAIERGDYKQ